jgi:Glucuronyl esterase, fungi
MRRMKFKAPGGILVALALIAVAAAAVGAAVGQFAYDRPGDKRFVNNTGVLERVSPNGANNQSYKITAPRDQVKAAFTSRPVTVDGIREAAWDAAIAYPIAHKFSADMTADAPAATTQGTLRLLWNGPVLYLLVEAAGDSTPSDSGTPNWTTASYAPTTDGVFVWMDVFNDQWGLETDTQGVFFLGANPALTSVTSYNNRGIPSLGSFFNATNQDYSTRLKAFKSSGYRAGNVVNYTYEIALQIEGWGDEWDRELKNGTEIGLEVGIYDQGSSFAYLSKTQVLAGREGNSNLPNAERVRNRDWGVVTLSGWDGATPFAYSGWRADEDIRFWNSNSNPGGDGSLVWSASSRARMLSARTAYEALQANAAATIAQKNAAVLEVCRAFAGLRWADARFPDPHDLPIVHTLPNVWQFFDKTKGKKGLVTNAAEWAERKREILDLAQFYEYGYKPRLGVDYTIAITDNSYAGLGNPTISARITPTNVRFVGGAPLDTTLAITLPANVPDGQKAPVSLGGNWTANGIATTVFPNWAADNRTDAGAWGNPNRNGVFYTLFPYARNSVAADSSILIANATGVSVSLDILQMAAAQNRQLNAKIDPTRAVTKGFSIGGKNAFVAALFDERIKVAVNGGSGATGPANWRYNAQGQEYDFSDTPFYNPGAESIVAHGTEGPGNSYRHNRVRETELFRHFMPYGHMYKHEDGSYGYGNYSRLPFDQALLVATLAPDRAILIDTNLNDYNDGAMTDNMSLQIAKSVYKTLGVDADNFVKFNSGSYVSRGDPHGAAGAAVEGKYLSDFFFGTHTLSDTERDRLNMDPYMFKVSGGKTQNPYDYYWGGFNTITGGRGGLAGTDGWFFYKLP